MTGLNIGLVPTKTQLLKAKESPCPTCKSGPQARTTETSFGTEAPRVLCGNCGHEFKEQA